MTYGTNAPNGFQPVRLLTGSAWTGATNSYPITSTYATALYKGDPVAQLNDGTIGVGVAGATIKGIFWGCKYTNSQGDVKFSPYWPANPGILTGSAVEALIIDDPNVVFSVQETDAAGAAGTPLALADVNLNINFLYTAGSASTGQSAVSLNNASENTTDTLNCKIIALDPNATVGAFANWLVTLNNQSYRAGVTGV